jgi:oligoendopeptidase F
VIETTGIPHRSDVPVEHTWNLEAIYADSAAWERGYAALEEQTAQLVARQGTLGQSAETLLATLRLRDECFAQLYQLYVYASHLKDSDSTNAASQALEDRANSLGARISAASSFIEPEILAIPDTTVRAWLGQPGDLQVYRHHLEELLRQRAHVRSAEVEAVIAQYSDITRAPRDAFDMLADADLQFPAIVDEAGNTVQLSHARYIRFLRSSDRRVRRDAFKRYYEAFQSIRNTVGVTLAAQVRVHVIEARLRNYVSALEAALSPNDIPVDVYHNLVATVNAGLPRLHRYMQLRKRIMGLDDLHIYDLYAPLLPEVDQHVSYEDARAAVQAAFAPLGPDYAEALGRAFSERWIDVYENVGKRSGAYSGGAYTTAPFILLNYQERLDDMFVLAHELGHSMHSFFTRAAQPFVYGNYTTFVAEVASTLNEALLTRHLLQTSDDEALRKHLIVEQLESVRTTLFRQTMFAEFELAIHQMAEAGEPLTTDTLSSRFLELVGRYHGPEVTLDPEIALEWARIPHFYFNFYVYQYATGLSAALALSRQLLGEGQPAVERYLRFLSSGSSRSPIDLLRDAGVDMATPEPIQAALDTFDSLLDDLERLI